MQTIARSIGRDELPLIRAAGAETGSEFERYYEYEHE